MNIGILLIATNKYKQFITQFIESASKYLFANHQLTIHLFTDEPAWQYNFKYDDRITICSYVIPVYKFPQATLYRYKIFTGGTQVFTDIVSKLRQHDNLFYSDVDMRLENTVGDELLQHTLLAVAHPGYYISKGWGSPNCSPQSLAYLPPDKRINYCAGGFQGGKAHAYLDACQLLAQRIDDDEKRGVMAEWHDETHWNWLINGHEMGKQAAIVSPEYCMVEQQELREKWGIANLTPRIVALKKNHEEVRS